MEEKKLLDAFENLEKANVIRSSFPNIISFADEETGEAKSFCFREGNLTKITDGTFYELHQLVLKHIPACKAVFQPHSHWGCVWAALGQSLPPVSLAHARKFFGEIHCTGELYLEQISGNLGKALYEQVKAFYDKSFPYKPNAVLLDQMGPLLLGDTVQDVMEKARVLEEAAEIAYQVRMIEGITYRHIHCALMEKFYTEGLDKK